MRILVTVFILLLLSPLGVALALAASEQDARQFVDSVGGRVLQAVDKGESGKAELRQLFIDNVDIGWMARFVLGRAWQQASADQRDRYMQAYERYLLARYTTNFADYSGSKYKITGVKNDGNDQYTVQMKIVTPDKDKPETLAGYRVRADQGGFKIFDIIVEDVSLITTQRSEFASIVQKDGMDALIANLEVKAQTGSR